MRKAHLRRKTPEEWERAEQKLIQQILRRREISLQKVKEELEDRAIKTIETRNLRFRSAACAVQFIQNQALMKELRMADKNTSKTTKPVNKKPEVKEGKFKLKKGLEIPRQNPLDWISKLGPYTWQERKVKEILQRQADTNALHCNAVANMLYRKTTKLPGWGVC